MRWILIELLAGRRTMRQTALEFLLAVWVGLWRRLLKHSPSAVWFCVPSCDSAGIAEAHRLETDAWQAYVAAHDDG
jgi:hypothetical protein